MSSKSLKRSQILRAHMTYFRRPSHIYGIWGLNVLGNSSIEDCKMGGQYPYVHLSTTVFFGHGILLALERKLNFL